MGGKNYECGWDRSFEIDEDYTITTIDEQSCYDLEEINSHFGIEFEGIQEGEVVNAKFKSAEIIKKELSKMNFEQ